MKDVQDAALFIEHWESFSSYAYWDVNAWRIGFGSDTRTRDQIPVHRGDHTTFQEALDNLEMRLPKYERVIVGQIGSVAWNAAHPHTQKALMDFAYNYGHLTHDIAALAHGQRWKELAHALRVRGYDNHGINRHRRDAEADLVEKA